MSKRVKTFLLIFVCAVILAASYYVYRYITTAEVKTNDNTNTSTSVTPTDNDEEESEPEVKVSTLYYRGNTDYSVYSYDIATNKSAKLFDAGDSVSIELAPVVNDLLPFMYCNPIVKNNQCQIGTYNVKTKVKTTVHSFKPTEYLLNFALRSNDKYAYSITTADSMGTLSKWKVVSVDSGEETVLEDLKISQEYGRGGFEEDSSTMQYNDSGDKLLLVETSSPRNSLDFNTYIYNLATAKSTKIANSTQSLWLDDNTIVYRKYDGKKGSGLYTYFLDSSQSVPVTGASMGYTPSLSADKKYMTFSDAKAYKTYKYDFATGETELVSKLSVYGKAIDSDHMFFANIKMCKATDPDCGGLVMYDITKYVIEDLKSEKTTNVNEGLIQFTL